MYLLLVVLVWIWFAWKFIDWSRVKEQYPTVIFFIAVNMTYNTLYNDHLLWAFRGITADWLNHTIINLAFTFFICPVALIIYLQKLPSDRKTAYLYVGVWIVFFTIIQTLFAHKGMYVYGNGWNGWHNIWLNTLLFLSITIHYRKPAITLLLAVPVAIIFYLFFPAPLTFLH